MRIGMKKILKVHCFKQDKSGYDCGPACIRMVLSYLAGGRPSKSEYKKILELAMDGNTKYRYGTSKRRLKRVIHRLGYKYRSVYELDGLEWAIEKELPVIVLCYMRDEEGDPYEHYIVVKGIENDYIHINDPYYGGSKRVRRSTFMSLKGNLYWKSRVKWGLVISRKL
jgi:predicted double-glycine peptidase